MEKSKNVNETGPRVLPIVLHKGEQYFTDLRLNEFRPIQGLLESIPFDGEEGRIICRNTGVVTCESCGMSTIISKTYEKEELRCMQCFSRIEPLSDK